MEKVHRVISLEQARNRTPNQLPYYAVDNPYAYEGANYPTCTLHDDPNDHHPWGEYCVDLLIPLTANECGSDKACVPAINWAMKLWDTFNMEKVEIVNEEGQCTTVAYWARYKNLMRIYFWLINTFTKSILFYKKCSSGFKRIHIESTYSICDSDIPLYPSLAAASLVEMGEIVGVTPLYEEFIALFKEQDNAQNFCQFIDKLAHDGLFEPLSGTTPYMDVEFAITSTQTDLGLMSPLAQQWEAKKKYYLGEIVLYNNCSYVLHTCDYGNYEKYEITGDLLKCVLSDTTDSYRIVDTVPDDIYNITWAREFNIPGMYTDDYRNYYSYTYQRCVLRETDENGFTKYSFIYPYYKGYFDMKTKLFNFDSSEGEHWVRMDSVLEGRKEDTSRDAEEFTGITESKLITLKRKVSSVDDLGEQLEFIINDDDDVAEMQYMLGITNEVIDYDEPNNPLLKHGHGDELTAIRYKSNDDDAEWQEITHEGGITPDDFDADSGIIEFTYYIGCDVDYTYTPPAGGTGEPTVTKTRIEYTGVKYVEEWTFHKDVKTFNYGGASVTYEYVYILPIYNDNYGAENLDIQNKKPIYSIVTYYWKQSKINEALITPVYKDEDILGLQNINTLEYDLTSKKYVNTINGYIPRGTAASFERHNILGEVKTFADLENYRNNFFQL